MELTFANLFRLAAILLMVSLAYLPGINSPYYFDDEHNIIENSKTQIRNILDFQTLSSEQPRVDQTRLFAYWTFGVNRLTTGLEDPGPLRLTNIGIHLFNVLLLYLFFYRLLFLTTKNFERTKYIALLAASVWALHPINSQSILYIVQRMTLLSATFSLLALNLYLGGRAHTNGPRLFRWILSIPVMIFGILSKETAVLIPFGIILVEWYIRAKTEDPEQKTSSDRLLIGGLLGLGTAAVTLCWNYADQFSHSFALRPFDVFQRVLTEGRVLILYLKLFLFPLPSNLHFLHDLEYSQNVFSPPSTLISWVVLLFIIVTSFVLRRKLPELFLTVGWFFLFHALEAGPLPLELAFEHRNYIPTTMLSLGLVLAIASILRSKKTTIFFTIAIMITFGCFTALRSQMWTRPMVLLSQDHLRYPSSARIALYRANLLKDQDRIEESYRLLSDFVRDYPHPVEHTAGFEQAEVFVFLGNYVSIQGNILDSINWYKRALEVSPGHQLALYNLVQAYLDLDDFRSAQTVFKHLEDLHPTWSEAGQLKIRIMQKSRPQNY